jgi:hypothetical protein
VPMSDPADDRSEPRIDEAEDAVDTDDHGAVNDMTTDTAVDEDTVETIDPENRPV